MIKLRESRAVAGQQAQPAAPQQLADENCNRSNQGGAAPLAVPKQSSRHQQRSPQPCSSEEAEEVGSDTECPGQLPLAMPAALPGAMPMLYASAPAAGLPGASRKPRSIALVAISQLSTAARLDIFICCWRSLLACSVPHF